VHGDLKLRNVIRRPNGQHGVCLCDLDASVEIDAVRNKSMKQSTAYSAPELQASLRTRADLFAQPSLDVWALGVILFELCTGRTLFRQDISNDNLVESKDFMQLATWNCISDDQLGAVFADSDAQCTDEQRSDARHMIRWCLQGDPERRPTMAQLLRHRFLTPIRDGGVAPPPLTKITIRCGGGGASSGAPDGAADAAVEHDVWELTSSRERFHVFISHAQIEASGDVGTLSHLFQTMGVHGWRDMTQRDLTEQGMRQGVYDSDVFVLFLTNCVLSRSFCLKEIQWALDFCKPILVVAETEERFWPFDLERWQRNECEKDTSVWPTAWKECWLQSPYEDCPRAVVDLVERAWAQQQMLPFRRREYEVNGLAREIIARAARFPSIAWGVDLPPAGAISECRRVVEVIASAAAERVHGIRAELVASMRAQAAETAATAAATAAAAEERDESAHGAAAESTLTIVDLYPSAASARAAGGGGGDTDEVTHTVVVLTADLLEACGDVLIAAVDARASSAITYVYLEPTTEGGWNFDDFYAHTPSGPAADAAPLRAVRESIASHEALKYRFLDPEPMRYEHDALVREIIARMNPHHQDEEEAAAAAEASTDDAEEEAGGAEKGARFPPALPRTLSLESPPRSPRCDDEGAIVAQLRAQIEFQRCANSVLRLEIGDGDGGGGGAMSVPVAAAALDARNSCSCYALRAAVHSLAREHKALSAKAEETKKAAEACTSVPQSELQRELAAARAANAQLLKRVAELETSAAMGRLSLHHGGGDS
jgi:hypothetical protein